MPTTELLDKLIRVMELRAKMAPPRRYHLPGQHDQESHGNRDGAGDVTETPAFKAWFGDSKVVDANGKPLVVYHGTDIDFEAFAKDKIKSKYPYSFGFHFTSRPSEADVYAGGLEASQHPVAKGVVLPVYISAQNPLVITTKEMSASIEADLNRYDIIHKLVEAKNAGHPYDSVIIKTARTDEWGGINVIVFSPTQIKSKFNKGTFNPKDPRISYANGQVATTLKGHRLALLGFDYADAEELARVRKDFAAYLASEGVEDAEAAANAIEHSWELATYHLPGQHDQESHGNWATGGGFYSRLTQAITEAKQTTAPASDWIAILSKAPGVTKDELAATKMIEFLRSKGTAQVTRDELLAFSRVNEVRLGEKVLGGVDTTGWTAKPMRNSGGDTVNGAWIVLDAQGNEVGNGTAFVTDTAEEAIEKAASFGGEGVPNPKFSQYVLPGGEDYKELLITLPSGVDRVSQAEKDEYILLRDKISQPFGGERMTDAERARYSELSAMLQAADKGDFKGPHYDEPNILAHTRFDTRLDEAGGKVLFLEEIQSDWAQQGREKGFAGSLDPEAETRRIVGDAWGRLGVVERQQLIASQTNKANNGVPSAPFVTDTKAWVGLAMKRMVNYAVANDFNSIAWTTGAQQADRYDLSKQIKSLTWSTNGETTMIRARGLRGEDVIRWTGAHTELPSVVGKDMAANIDQQPRRKDGTGKGEFTGLDLKVGGEGMKAFYDGIVPQVANGLLKRLGGTKVEPIKIRYGKQFYVQQGFTIPLAMKERIKRGLALFEGAEPARVYLGQAFLADYAWRGALDLTRGSMGLKLFNLYREIKRHDAYQPHEDDPGVMIAVKVPDEVAKQLAVKGGNKPDDMHCTLVYLGRLSKVEAVLPAVRQALAEMTPNYPSMTGVINGLGRFGASESSDGKEVIYATLDCPGLVQLRTDLVSAIEAAGAEVAKDHDFTPHITLSYVEPGQELDVPLPDYEIEVSYISLVVGGATEQVFGLGPKTYDNQDYASQRPLSPAERRVDFAAIKSIFDHDAAEVDLKLRRVIKEARDSLVELVTKQMHYPLTAEFAQSVQLSTGPEFAKIVEGYLLSVWRKNRDLALNELPEDVSVKLGWVRRYEGDEQKEYASSFSLDVAGNYFFNRSLMIKGLVDDELTKQVKLQIFQSLLGDSSQDMVMKALDALFEPWMGDPTKIVPSGISRTPEDILKPYRLENITRTETANAMNLARKAVGEAASDFIIGWEHSSILDERTSLTCDLADGIKFSKDNPKAGTLSPPLHWNCFPNAMTSLYTAEGWKAIVDIKVGDQVLTHKGRFRPVTKLFNTQKYNGDVIRLSVAQPKLNNTNSIKDHVKQITVTPEHPVLTDTGWVPAEQLTAGMNVIVAAVPCRVCGKPVPLMARRDPRFCSRRCNVESGWATLHKRWADPQYRKRRTKQISDDMLRQYADGVRNGKKITAAAHVRTRQMAKSKDFHLNRPEVKAASVVAAHASPKWRKAVTVDRMGKNNPMFKHPETIPNWTAKMKQFFLDHPERHPNSVLAAKGGVSKPQKLLFECAKKIDVTAELNYPVKLGRRLLFLDVALPENKIALEYDGSYWHQDDDKDDRRDADLREVGWTVLRYRDRVPEAEELGAAVARVLMNHKQQYSFVPLRVAEVKRDVIKYRPKRLYNVAVAEDESYVVRGVVFHNCRSLDLPVFTIDEPVDWTSEAKLDKVIATIPKGWVK